MTGASKATGPLRWMRAGLLSVVAVVTGSVAHVSADGVLPGAWAMAAIGLLVTLAAGLFLGAPASTFRVVGLVVSLQASVHVLLSALAGHTSASLVGRTPVGTEHAQVVHLADHLTGQNVLMAMAHLVAAALLGLWLAVGERALWTVLTLTMAPLDSLLRCTLALGLRRHVVATLDLVRNAVATRRSHRPVVRLLHLESHVVSHRGPPALLAT